MSDRVITLESNENVGNPQNESNNQLKHEEINEKEDPIQEQNEKEEEWMDILGSGQLLKKIVKKGLDDSRPQRSDVCTVKYVGKLDDNVVDEGLVTINLGDGEVIQGLDFALPLMNLEEEAEVIVGPRFAFGSEGRLPDIPPNATLQYTVTLINAKPEPIPETLSLQDRTTIGNRKRERGNYWYSRKEHTLAIQCYRRALEYLDEVGLAPSNESKSATLEEIHSLLDDRIKVYNNLAAAQMKINALDSALQSVDNVLRCQPNNLKALYRKAKVKAEKGDTEEAISLLKKTLVLDPENIPAKNELNLLLVRKKKDTDRQKKLYKKMLGTTNITETPPQSPTREAGRWGLVVGCVGALFSAFLAYKYYRPI